MRFPEHSYFTRPGRIMCAIEINFRLRGNAFQASRPYGCGDASRNRVVVDRSAAFGKHSSGGKRSQCVANLEATRERYGQRDTRAGIIVDGCECEASVMRGDILD